MAATEFAGVPQTPAETKSGGSMAPGQDRAVGHSMNNHTPVGVPPVGAAGAGFFGHPCGLAILFFTELWERFSYYGMRALLVLFMTATTTRVVEGPAGGAVENPGLGFDLPTAAATYGLFTSLVYIMALPGGWIADSIWGQRKAVWVGGWIIAAGNFAMAIPSTATFIAGLGLVICGTGLLKPNVSTMVGELYPDGHGHQRRRLPRPPRHGVPG